ncbi:MAG TPA: SDR family NAD(P)-dependent oxidoreductase [Mycobacterium sp.]|uniref:SDR family NAD(P)-dependent oxidoreductase n=1 Tax=Mycobacterium sp. TaxID=1785 RepID=UPI002B8B4934|nr:SDR family NAD(P)-dependent oxidoreductase [Mycobacterium sp.]HME74818.1 SDR family NAD(P)-dependent oxidoreductase [Mycobacterium sp.]
MNLVAKAFDKIVNPPRVSDPDRLRAAVSGKTVLVTGASYGLGEATARKLGAAGATVLLVARSADRLAALAASVNAGGGRAAAYPADLTDLTAVAALAKRLTENHGPMDVVVSNAGKSIRRSLHLQYDRPQDFDRTIDVNYLGPVRLLLGLLPAMRRRGSGHIVNISTLGVRTAPGPRWGTYLASKTAFDVWLRSVAPELRADGVHVTSVYMTLMHTRMSAPTPILRRLPGLYPEQAADIVAKAIIERPRTVQPLWVWPVEISSMLLPGPLEVGMRLLYRFSTDSPSAQGIQR